MRPPYQLNRLYAFSAVSRSFNFVMVCASVAEPDKDVTLLLVDPDAALKNDNDDPLCLCAYSAVSASVALSAAPSRKRS
jgi:hypothetical protein